MLDGGWTELLHFRCLSKQLKFVTNDGTLLVFIISIVYKYTTVYVSMLELLALEYYKPYFYKNTK